MGIMKAHYRTFFLALAVGSWLFLGFLLPICSIHLVLSGRRLWRTFGIGQTGFFTEVELELREEKAGRLGGMKNWHIFGPLVGD